MMEQKINHALLEHISLRFLEVCVCLAKQVLIVKERLPDNSEKIAFLVQRV